MSNATKETVIVLDFGGQYNQLIARRVRECNVYCEILPYTVDIQMCFLNRAVVGSKLTIERVHSTCKSCFIEHHSVS